MTDHPTSTEIARLVRGTLPREGRRQLVAHLLAGCPRCARLAAPALALNPALLGRHVRRAARRAEEKARAAGSPAAGEPVAGGEAEGTAALAPDADGQAARTAALADDADDADDRGERYERPVARACAAAIRRLRALERERRAAAAPPRGAAGTAPGLADVEQQHLRGLLRVETLLAASWELRYSDPREMLRLAELALFAAERLEQARYGRAAVADVRARVWAELANAHRVGDDIVRAELAMARAVSWVHRGSGDPWLLACVADLMASLLADQRRFADAGELLEKVHRFYLQMGDRHLAGRALISRGIFAGYDNQPRSGLALLLQGLDLLDIQRDPRLAAHAVHALLSNLVDCGRYRQARIHLWRSRSLFARHGDRLSSLRLRWLDGRIHAGLGELERAERELLATRQGFATAGNPYHTALVALDLAAVWLRQGKTEQVRQLVEEMIATFRALRIAREAVAALLILRQACDRDEATLDRVRTVAMLLTELERQPRRQPGPALADMADAAD
ncbi:MAG TPA: hypothetical protein VHG32_06920 [Thermoanaerobaculia bacterium]|nr:hypothetical protein [Thermoanaerobaculia bacterium]